MSVLVDYSCSDGIAHIIMDDGKLNVMSLEMLEALGAAFDRAAEDNAVVVLRSGRSGIFSAGFDLKVFALNDPERSLAMVRAGAELLVRLMTFPFPIVGVVSGHAFPMGAFLLLACDFRLGAAEGYQMGLNEVAIGITPPNFGIELARSRVLPAWLSRTVTTGEMFEPADALAAGFIDKIVPREMLDDATVSAAAGLKKIHLPSHLQAKQRLRGGALEKMRAAIADELTIERYRARQASTVVLPGKK